MTEEVIQQNPSEAGLTSLGDVMSSLVAMDPVSYPAFTQLFKLVEQGRQLDFGVFLGHNWENPTRSDLWTLENPANPSIVTQSTALVAGLLLKMGVINKAILSGGNTTQVNDHPTEAQAMLDYIKLFFGDSIESRIVLEKKSIDTHSNAKEVLEILQALNLETGLLCSAGFHLRLRARLIFKSMGVSQVNGANVPSNVLLAELRSLLSDKFVSQVIDLHPEYDFLHKLRFVSIMSQVAWQKTQKVLPWKKHGVFYHFAGRVYQTLTGDPSAKKLHAKTVKRRGVRVNTSLEA